VKSLWRRVATGRRAGEALDWSALAAFRDLTGTFIPPGHADAVLVLDRTYMSEMLKKT
jgi:hypothetical protein